MAESENEVATETPQAEPEETLSKARVNEIVKREKALAADKVRREMEAQHAQEIESLKAAQPQSAATPTQAPDIRQTVQQLLNEEIQRYQAEQERSAKEAHEAQIKAELEKSAQQYLLKVEQSKKDIPDFDDVMKDFDLGAFSGVALLAGQLENPAAVMYELAQNPLKVAQLHSLVQSSPMMAKKEMQKLADSITKNKQALEANVTTNAPLSRLKSSTVVGGDSGEMGLKDMKKAPWNRV